MRKLVRGSAKKWIWGVAVSASLLAVRSVSADSRADAVTVIANKRVPASIELAKYYVQRRGLAPNRIVEIDVADEDFISRKDYEQNIALPIRKQLEQKGIAAKTRILVTTYGVPLRLNAPEPTAEENAVIVEAKTYRASARKRIQEVIAAAYELSGEKPPKVQDGAAEQSDEALVEEARKAVRECAQKMWDLPDEGKRREARVKINNFVATFSGVAGIAQSTKVAPGAENKDAEAALEKLKHDVQVARTLLQRLDEIRTPENRKRGYSIAAQTFGAVGALGRANAFIRALEYKEADASVDSELEFVWWDRDQYLVANRVPNPMRHNATPLTTPVLLPLVLVSRIDASDLDKAKHIIDSSLQAEAEGLKGTAYIDARGLPESDPKYGMYDENLRDLADLLDDETEIPTTLENTDARFSKKGEAPDVALYSGWYRLRHYEDAFTFVPGAIGYHVASEEAVTLHKSDETGWCKNALDRGISATLGAVAEPYLDAFPPPLDFFGMLLSGRFNLIESYALTSPYVSWRMVLIGDPLYQPFRKPLVQAKALAERSNGAADLESWPQSPLDKEFPDPVAARALLAERKKQLEGEIAAFYKALEERRKESAKDTKRPPKAGRP